MNADVHAALLRERLPDLEVSDLRPLPHHGWGGDCDVYLADGRLIVSFPRSPEVAASLDVQTRLLPRIAERVPVAVPSFERVVRDPTTGLPLLVAYPRIPGAPLRGPAVRRLEATDPAAFGGIALDLAGFLTGLHSLPIERAVAAGLEPPRLAIREGVERQRERARDLLFPALGAEESAALDRLFDAYLGDPACFGWEATVCHGDLSSDHVLADGQGPSYLSGVIDFCDLTVGDPAGEMTWRAEYGEAFFWRVLESYRPADDLAAFARAVDFRWRLIPTVEIAYGLELGNVEYVAEGRRELRQRLLGA